jgi:hypothetical protein
MPVGTDCRLRQVPNDEWRAERAGGFGAGGRNAGLLTEDRTTTHDPKVVVRKTFSNSLLKRCVPLRARSISRC